MNAQASNHRWHVAEEDRAKTSELARGLDVPRIVAHLLAIRGIDSVQAGRTFLEPSLDALSDPFSFTDMRAAVDRIAAARERNERILVFGDYDVDGIAGTAIVLNALRRFGIECCTHGMPSRLIEGYGISPEHVEAAQTDGVNLIITVDNGINAREAVATARRLGIDFIVTDHHLIEGDLPDALAVINPKREPEPCFARYISGAGVAMHLARALTGVLEDLDLVALGTVADIVPLRQENRILVSLGLQDLMQRRRVGIAELARVASTDLHEITAERVAFQLAPRLNAAGRLGDGLVPLKLLMTDVTSEAARMASELNKANEERRGIERLILDDAIQEIENTFTAEQRSIVLARRGWHPGVIGIVASRLHTLYNRPVVLIALDEDGLGRGSARSTDDFDMVAALSACKDFMVRFGGHSAAAGLTLEEAHFEAFRRAFEDEAAKRLPSGDPGRTLAIDALVSFSEIDGHLVKALDRLEPFGCMNPHPVFCTCGVTPEPHSFRELRGGHARLTLQQGPRQFEAIGFNMAGLIQHTVGSRPIDVAFTPKFNTWRGETTVQLVLKDIHTT